MFLIFTYMTYASHMMHVKCTVHVAVGLLADKKSVPVIENDKVKYLVFASIRFSMYSPCPLKRHPCLFPTGLSSHHPHPIVPICVHPHLQTYLFKVL